MKRGSALLIVLGMLAFMVISAVAFSAYMRYSRLPSSYLRRTSSSRLLAKAALAEAIDEIDAAIANNIHPGVGVRSPRPTAGLTTVGLGGTDLDSRTRNHWRGRVYIGTNQLHEAEETVSTLTLEGLAYVPPPLVNEARYYSRRSQGGCWKKLGFDTGRYAFCALGVSDYFDVNAVPANRARSSAAESRVSLAYLFESPDHSTDSGNLGSPSDWDAFMNNFLGNNKVPLVSIADWNLALFKFRPTGWESQFCEYVANGRTSFYGGIAETAPEADDVRRQTFVTDCYYPSVGGSGANDDYDLADPRHQPWTSSLSGPAGSARLGDVMNNLTDAGKRIRDRISALGMAELYDYLDENNVPLSLSIPQAERTPMITAIQPELNGASVAITAKTDPADDPLSDAYPPAWGGKQAGPGSTTRAIKYKKTYSLDPQKFSTVMMGNVKSLVAYPFRRGQDVADSDTFTIDGHLSLFLTTGDFHFRTGNGNDDNAFRMTDEGGNLGTKNQFPQSGIFHAQLPNTACALPSVNNSDENKTVVTKDLTGGQDAAQAVYNAVKDNPILTVTWEQPQMATKNEMTGTWSWQNNGDPSIVEANCGIRPLKPNGRVDGDFDAATLRGWIKDGTRQVTVRAAVWLRVRNGDSRTVDLVPACLNDDKTFLTVDNNNSMGPAGSDDLGSAYPVLFFNGGSFAFSLAGNNGFDNFTEVPLNFEAASGMKGVMCLDPRWNWAPEHWYAVNGISASDWVNAVHAFQAGVGCDSDVFMATSDAGYLQSIYELAFLPRVTPVADKLSNHGYGDYTMGNVQSPNDNAMVWKVGPNEVRNNHLMWRTYCPYNRQTCDRDDFTGGGDPWFVSEGGGIKINPYSDSTNVIMAAFANTPFDWWAASTNFNAEVNISESERKNARQFNKKYAFNEFNSNAKLKWQDLEAIAREYMRGIHDPGRLCDKTETDVEAWEDVWNALDWDGQNSDFCGVTLSGSDQLFDVDRKFLYGYWRDCFAARQQLFLVFVRAEPAMMGGGSGGKTPPQLGARAVALVWRDPIASSDERRPHRTRILFYRQLD